MNTIQIDQAIFIFINSDIQLNGIHARVAEVTSDKAAWVRAKQYSAVASDPENPAR